MKLYGYFRSSAAYRVRIALNFKGLAHEHAFVHLTREGGEHKRPDYLARNPQGLVPALEVDTGDVLAQSLAMLEYLEETYPEPPLLPGDAIARAKVRAMALAVACDIHPLNNLRVLRYLKHQMGQPQDAIDTWYRHWVEDGFAGLESTLGDDGYCFGGQPSLADVCLIPQIYNAHRFEVDLARFPRIAKIEAVCGELDPFAAAHPSRQPDAE